jgi:pre-mRNA-splicing helicase BRR2
MDPLFNSVNIVFPCSNQYFIVQGFALVADMTFVQQSACRLMRALFEIALKRSWASLANRALVICKMVERRIWSSQSPLRQFTGIPDVIIRKLEKNSDVTWERYHDLSPQDLGEMVKMPKMGKILHKYVHNFPKFQLNANVLPITRGLMKIELTITPDFQYDPQVRNNSSYSIAFAR